MPSALLFTFSEWCTDFMEIALQWKTPLTPFLILSGASQVALVIKNLPANAGDIRDMGSIPWWGRSPGEGNGNLLQYSCLEYPMDRGAWWAIVHGGLKESDMTEAT